MRKIVVLLFAALLAVCLADDKKIFIAIDEPKKESGVATQSPPEKPFVAIDEPKKVEDPLKKPVLAIDEPKKESDPFDKPFIAIDEPFKDWDDIKNNILILSLLRPSPGVFTRWPRFPDSILRPYLPPPIFPELPNIYPLSLRPLVEDDVKEEKDYLPEKLERSSDFTLSNFWKPIPIDPGFMPDPFRRLFPLPWF